MESSSMLSVDQWEKMKLQKRLVDILESGLREVEEVDGPSECEYITKRYISGSCPADLRKGEESISLFCEP